MNQITDQILSLLPVLISLAAMILLLVRYQKLNQNHHYFLMIVFGLLTFSYLYSFIYCQKMYGEAAILFPLRQPVNLLLVPFSSIFGYYLFVNDSNRQKHIYLHAIPAILVFIGFLPFWFLSPDVQTDYLSVSITDYDKYPTLEKIELLRQISIYAIFNVQLLVYNIVLILKFIKFDKTHASHVHSYPGGPETAINLVFYTFLLVLINNAYFLGVSVLISSRIFFNIISAAILIMLFVTGYTRKSSITASIPVEEESDLESEQND